MTDFVLGILEHLISETLFLIILIGLAWFLYYFTKRKKLYRFFCITETKRLNVYLSRLNIQHHGALAINGTPASFVGITIVYNEAIAANKFRDKFNYLLPSLSDKPGLLSKLLLSDVLVKSIVSVTNQSEIDTTTSLITLGSPTYNFVSEFIQNNSQTHVQFAVNGASININGLQPITNTNYGFIQRIYDMQNNRSYFYAAGLSELGTMGAAHFLAENWSILYNKFKGESNFLVVLAFSNANLDNWNIVLEKTW